MEGNKRWGGHFFQWLWWRSNLCRLLSIIKNHFNRCHDLLFHPSNRAWKWGYIWEHVEFNRNASDEIGGGPVTSLITMLLTGGSISGGLRQEPQLTSCEPFDVYSKPFSQWFALSLSAPYRVQIASTFLDWDVLDSHTLKMTYLVSGQITVDLVFSFSSHWHLRIKFCNMSYFAIPY